MRFGILAIFYALALIGSPSYSGNSIVLGTTRLTKEAKAINAFKKALERLERSMIYRVLLNTANNPERLLPKIRPLTNEVLEKAKDVLVLHNIKWTATKFEGEAGILIDRVINGSSLNRAAWLNPLGVRMIYSPVASILSTNRFSHPSREARTVGAFYRPESRVILLPLWSTIIRRVEDDIIRHERMHAYIDHLLGIGMNNAYLGAAKGNPIWPDKKIGKGIYESYMSFCEVIAYASQVHIELQNLVRQLDNPEASHLESISKLKQILEISRTIWAQTAYLTTRVEDWLIGIDKNTDAQKVAKVVSWMSPTPGTKNKLHLMAVVRFSELEVAYQVTDPIVIEQTQSFWRKNKRGIASKNRILFELSPEKLDLTEGKKAPLILKSILDRNQSLKQYVEALLSIDNNLRKAINMELGISLLSHRNSQIKRQLKADRKVFRKELARLNAVLKRSLPALPWD